MHNGQLYLKFNHAQRAAASEVLDEFSNVFCWPKCGYGSLLDVGCGPGDVLIDFVVPKIPKKCKIVGVDISEEMIECAKRNFEGENVKFIKLDFL